MVKYVIKELTSEGRLVDPLVSGGYDSDYNPFEHDEYDTPELAGARIDEEISKEKRIRFGAVGGITYRNLVIIAIHKKLEW